SNPPDGSPFANNGILSNVEQSTIYKPTLIVGITSSNETSWQTFLNAISQLQQSVDNVYINELFDQPWKGISPTVSGALGSMCGQVYPMPYADPNNIAGPPLPAQLPAVCSPDL
ncbi:MAG: hypothetical protein ACPGT2_00325, partial [Ilumatobacteraceae bacterium]